ncbi:hypothetical protein B0H13DRAFT_1966080 [Mycena leptocephala]|nr:hypothetical protein B0H13DRAFT_1966080 [Mycena leptocephala]
MEPPIHSLRSSVIAIPELLDHIIDYLSGSPVDLLSCAMVSKSWVRRAQFHLFSKIMFIPPNHTSIFERLAKSLEVSPHLAHLIRHLSITLDIDLLEGVTRLILPSLEELAVDCTDDQYSFRQDVKTMFLVEAILRLPTIRCVTLSGLFNSISVIDTYFSNCSRGIQTLGLSQVYVDLTEASPDPPVSSFHPQIQLSHFIIPCDFSALEAWIFAPQCPFGFSRLKSIHISGDQWRPFQSILAPSFPSIEYLKLMDFSGHVGLDLTVLTSLKRLDVDLYQLQLPEFLVVLGRLPPHHCLHTLGLLIYAVSTRDEKTFKSFDTSIAALDIASSLRVEIHLQSIPILDMSVFKSYFPTLISKGQLFIHLPTPPDITYVGDEEEGYTCRGWTA